MGRAALVTPLYISVAWTLMVSYQFFTETAVITVANWMEMSWPSLGIWLVSRLDMLIFVHAFAWVFLLSSAIPSVILGKQKGILTQFFVCLALTFSAFIVQDILTTFAGRSINQIFSLAFLFTNPFLAMGYLSIPYLLMLGLDVYSKRKRRIKEKIENATDIYLQDAAGEQDAQEDG